MDAEVWIESIQDANNPVLKYLLRTDYQGSVSADAIYLTKERDFNFIGPYRIDIIHQDYQPFSFIWDDPDNQQIYGHQNRWHLLPLDEIIVLEPK